MLTEVMVTRTEPLSGCVAAVAVGGVQTCGEMQQAEVGVNDSLLPQHQQGHFACCGLRDGALHLPQQQQHLHHQKACVTGWNMWQTQQQSNKSM